MIDAQVISDGLGGKRSGKGFLAPCPSHDDHDPSLSIADGDNGKPIVHCLAGCSQEAVITGLAGLGLWPETDKPLTPQELEALKKEAARRKEERAARRRQEETAAAEKAREQWEQAKAADSGHPYLAKKGIQAHRLRQEANNLLAPMRDESGQVWALQAIAPDGSKLFSPPGCRTKGLYFSIGSPGAKLPICIVEGFATGAAIYEATGYPVAIAFTAGNLEAVARSLKTKLPKNNLVLCADDDLKPGTDQNPGIEAAIRAAQAVGGKVAYPGMGKKADFWDLWHEKGSDAVRDAIEEAQANIKQYGCTRAVTIDEFLSLEFPPRDNLLSPWLPAQGLTMVYAMRGIGKTFFALGVAYAVATGNEFLGWKAEHPAGVLYIDGEMPAAVMQKRLSDIVASNDLEPVAPFVLLTPDLQAEGMPHIDTPEGQEAINAILTDEIKLIIIDNISTLTRTKENEADSWTPVQEWALRQRAVGRSVLFVHHAGKGGQQRGTSRREDVLDTVITLKRPVDYLPDQGAVFEIHFEKARGIYGDDVAALEARLATSTEGLSIWCTRSVEVGNYERVVQLLNEGLKQHEIAIELGINKSNVSRHVKRAKAEGLCVAG
jgi:putative DNA primase/helicase